MLRIRSAAVEDVPTILELVCELARYEGLAAHVRITEADLSRDGFGSQPEFRALIAEWEGVSVGCALFFNHYSTWRGAGFYLEDLFVLREFRGRGVGKALVAAVASIAAQENRGFIRWAVLDWNQQAIALYRRLGADFLDRWQTMLLADDSLKRLTNEVKGARN